MAVAVDQCHGFKPFARPPRYKLQSFSQVDYQALDFGPIGIAESLEHAFEFSNVHKSFSTPCLLSYSSHQLKDDAHPRIEIISGRNEPRIRALAAEVAMALASRVNPEPISKGLGGAYLFRACNGDTIAVAKPTDEEPLAFNNPKGLVGRKLGQPGMKCSIKIGETGARESAAYFLDHDGFSGVPPTGLVTFSHVKFNSNGAGLDSTPAAHLKIASLQRFVDHDSDAGDLGPSSFSVASVHRIGVLDIRLMNLDRHAGNILVKLRNDGYARGTAELVPIDHGFCLPEYLDDPYFEWLHWPQASIPFSETDANYISSLDPYNDAEILRTKLPSLRESSIRVLVVCTIFLKRATAYGLCLADIGMMMTRELHGGNESLSVLENICVKAKASMIIDKKMFEFAGECNVDVDPLFDSIPGGFHDSPTKGKPSKIPRISPAAATDESGSGKRNGELYHFDDHAFNKLLDSRDSGGKDYANPKAGSLAKSQSFAAPNHNREGQCITISFGEMNDGEWRLFLEYFETLLPGAFEEKKFTGLSMKQHASRSSCVF
ncbi:phosphatidylinositol 4-kinase gamma 1-like [Andrographis paniculata]|uniref:phosphatidylinositol 4-kinase gamma 1-like n=1 Tax=Andrographis paniculata TaxID=175694 RepID=UPI0021E8C1EF|nr:phosphatidylinositol 4-kinase gamma 1-like [Andrographis paniculata]XP_051138885.1 phosphatidylinositol 4-kinase gamma 1-like [Andrographis paniculata]XP_051138886.1 phosphatidylinositol 4-kinase gamma 1-like [Andrographis paniculata]